MKQSPLFTINWHDVLKGLIMAVLTPAVFIIQQTLQNGTLTFNWKSIGMAAVAGGVGYIIKNFLTPESKK
jgi:hypothetical protein